jgi:uncharacterized membrane protein
MGVQESGPAERETDPSFFARWLWKEGAIAGFVAAALSALAITLLNPDVLSQQIAGLYSLQGSLVAGWIAHLVHGTVFGVVFAAVLTDPTMSGARKTPRRTVVSALVFGLVLAVAGAGVLMPMWLDAIGVTDPPPLPNVTTALVLWHGVYGLVLGVGFAMLDPGDRAERGSG